jgi:hypothetical protein
MPFKLTSIIKIGEYQFNGGVNEVKIKRSCREIVDTAVLKIPALAQVANYSKKRGIPQGDALKSALGSVKSSTFFAEGDSVSIQLGYNRAYCQEFKGFVRRVSPSIPVEIECEGYAWQLRRKVLSGSWKIILLLDFLKILVAGTDIIISPHVQNTKLTGLHFPASNGLKVLELLRDKAHLCCYFLFDTLYVGLEELSPGDSVAFRLGWNTIKTDDLKWRVGDKTPVQVKLIGKKGKKQKAPTYITGDADGALITEHIGFISDPVYLQKVADDVLQRAKYSGFEGGILCFLQPFIQMTDTAVIIYKIYKQRGGKYFTVGTEVTFGVNGGRRKIFIGRRLGGNKETG